MKWKRTLVLLALTLAIPLVCSFKTISVIGSKFMREKSPHEHASHAGSSSLGLSSKKSGSPLTAGADHHLKATGTVPPEAGKSGLKESSNNHKDKPNEQSVAYSKDGHQEGIKGGSPLTSGHSNSINSEVKHNSEDTKKSSTNFTNSVAPLALGSAAASLAKPDVNRKTEYGAFKDFFSNTSKNNENLAWKALSCFIGGILMFFGSIYLTCWNERQSVKQSQLIDIIEDDRTCQTINESINTNDLCANKCYLISGNISIVEEAKIKELSLDFPYTKNNVLMIKYDLEEYDLITTPADHENNTREQVTSKWGNVPEYMSDVPAKLKSSLYCGIAQINGIYQFEISKLRYLAEQGKDSHPYIFQMEDKDKLQAYLKDELNSNYSLYIERDCAYLVQSSSVITGWNSASHNFMKGDKRIKIRYVSLHFNNLVLSKQ